MIGTVALSLVDTRVSALPPCTHTACLVVRVVEGWVDGGVVVLDVFGSDL